MTSSRWGITSELKFGPIARNLAVFHCAIFLIGALTAQCVAMGTIANMVLGINYEWALLIGSGVTIFYSTAGGMPAVVKTDVLQFAILVIGIGSAAGLLFVKHGGFTGIYERLGPEPFDPLNYGTPTELITLFIAFFLGEMFVPPYTMRCFIAKDPSQAGWGIGIAGVFLLLFLPLATFILGTTAQMDPEITAAVGDDAQRAFPALIRVTFDPIFAGVMIAALVAAVMSSADSLLSSSATVVMEDLYRRYYKPEATDRELLQVARWSTLSVGVGATALAFFFKDITDILKFVYDFWGAGMVLPFLIGLFWYRRDHVPAVVVSMVVALLATPVWQILDNPYGFSAAFFGLLAALATFFVALCFPSLRAPGPDDHR